VYDIHQVTNNEFMTWFVKRYIAKDKGEKVHWAKATPSTAQEKASREEAKVMKSGSTDFVGKVEGRDPTNLIRHSTSLSTPMRLIVLTEKHPFVHLVFRP
jgi:hypothetical protein